MRSELRRTVTLALSFGLASCGANAPDPAGPALVDEGNAPSRSASTSPLLANAGIKQRMQGTWEIVRYMSERPIPDSAMPLMGEMFDLLRVRFEGDAVRVHAGRHAEEHARFAVTDEHGEAFRLVSKGGLFNGARCHFVDADTWEAADHGAAWPGVSVLRRVER